MNTVTYITLCVYLLSCVRFSLGIRCKDEDNRDVDWFIIYKLPKIDSEPQESDLEEGKSYAFITSNRPTKWRLSRESIESQTSMLGRTWKDFDSKKKNSNTAYLFYNDDAPEPYNGTAVGHLKGIVAFDTESGFWLIHSIPRFGEVQKYEYPKTALVNGQSAICVSFNTPTLNEICNHLLYCNPNIYQYNIANPILQMLEKTAKTLFTNKPAFIRKEPFERQSVMRSLGNEVFYSFAKDNQLQTDIYSEILASNLNTSLIAETWRRGAGVFLPPSCRTKYTVTDIVSITMVAINRKLGISFKSTEDHSKWTIALESRVPWVCIGDLNRMASQARRGGGALCFQSRVVWQAYRSIVAETSLCPA